LLLVDQFEELFHYQGYAGQEEAEAFVALLLESGRSNINAQIYVVLTMRSEYLGACSLMEGLAERMNAAQFLTPRMTRDQCRAAIEGPAEVCGVEVEPSLVNSLLNELTSFAPWESVDDDRTISQLDRLARRADQLPLLQHTLNRMWERAGGELEVSPASAKVSLRLADYMEMGGLKETLNRHADQTFNDLHKCDQLVAKSVFRALTSGTSVADAARRPTLFKDLVAVSGGSEERVRNVIQIFRARGRNFLLPEDDVPIRVDTRIDISHESVIRQWRRLSHWVDVEARDARQWRRLVDSAELELKGQGDLLQGVTLQFLLDWRDEAKPTPEWARRYGSFGSYDEAMDFLNRSQAAEIERQEAARERQIQQIKTNEEVARLRAEREAIHQKERADVQEQARLQLELDSWKRERRARLVTARVALAGALVAVFIASLAIGLRGWC
jgi:hypothetical protein